MYIQSLNVHAFGRLKEKEYPLSDGINVFYGPNESGKSTLTRFIRFMLYGFPEGRLADLAKNDKKKYLPWDDDSLRGELALIADGQNYTVRREQSKRASFSITRADGTPVFPGVNAGDAFLGVAADVYDKTALISAGDVLFSDADSLMSAIKNTVFSADEAVDSDEALRKLETLRYAILGKAQRSGRLYDARKELADLCARRNAVIAFHKELLGAEAALERVHASQKEDRAILDRLEKEERNRKAHEAKGKLDELCEAENAFLAAKEEHDSFSLSLTFGSFLPDRAYLAETDHAVIACEQADGRIENTRADLAAAEDAYKASFADEKQMRFNASLEKAGKTADEIAGTRRTLSEGIRKAGRLAVLFTCLLVTFPVGIWFFIKKGKLKKEQQTLLDALDCASAEELDARLARYDVFRDQIASAERRRDDVKAALDEAIAKRKEASDALCALLEKSGLSLSLSDTSAIADAAKRHIADLAEKLDRLEALAGTLAVKETAFRTLDGASDRKALTETASLFDPALPVRTASELQREIGFYTEAMKGLAERERDMEKKVAVIAGNTEKPDELTAAIDKLSDDIRAMEKQHAALALACEALENAHESMRTGVSPVLTEKTSALFRLLTDGKYRDLCVDASLALSFRAADDASFRPADYLSTGALDAAYLCTRLTLIQYLYKEKPVLLFDDAFSHIDDERLKRICDMLKQLAAQGYQIVIFSCHDREMRFLDGAAAVHTL